MCSSDLGFPPADAGWEATVPASEVNALLSALLQRDPEADVTVADPPLEDVLRTAFGAARAEPT